MSNELTQPDRLHDLLADEATMGLEQAELGELERLLGDASETDRDAYGRAAAAIDLAFVPSELEPLPASVRERLEAAAIGHLADRRGLSLAGGPARPRIAAPAPPAPARRAGGNWLPWLVAAACVAIAAIAWWSPDAPDAPQRLAALRTALLDRSGTGLWEWTDVVGGGVTGDVVWNNQRQEGVLRIKGLAPNDPESLQYQLWIFDDARKTYSAHNAVDGGVFDVDPQTGDCYVRIRPALEVFDPSLFAVTSEPPGGVVEHNPERDPDKFKILMTATVG
ncbi:MAG: anti-sigma factor [Planctomycetota bacterium]|jgi:hypothetical protein